MILVGGLCTVCKIKWRSKIDLNESGVGAHKGPLQHSLLAQSPLVCGKNVRIPFQRRELIQGENVHSGKTIQMLLVGDDDDDQVSDCCVWIVELWS